MEDTAIQWAAEVVSTQSRGGEGFFVADGDRTIVGWSPGMSRILGVPPDEALGQGCYRLMRRLPVRDPLPCARECIAFNEACSAGSTSCLLARDRGLGAWSLRHERITTSDGDLVIHRVRDASLDVISAHFLRRLVDALEEDIGDLRQAQEKAYSENVVLTPRAVEVLQLLGQGLDTKTVAQRLSISYFTARNYVQSLLTQLNAHNRVEAVVTAQRLGILHESGPVPVDSPGARRTGSPRPRRRRVTG